MNLAKAIEIKSEKLRRRPYDFIPGEKAATELLIEAGKRLEDLRKGYPISPKDLLTGETEE